MSEPIALSIKAELPCPFCGGTAELHKHLRGGHAADEPEAFAYFYICDSCACAGGWGKSEGAALHMWTMRPETKYCRGEGCPRADLCRRHMEAVKVDRPIYFERSPLQADGQCGEFASNGWLRASALQCGGAHPPPRCAWDCQIEMHRWEKQGAEWIWTGGVEH